MYKKAAEQKLRFATNYGSLSVEQLFDLSVAELDILAVSLETAHKESGKKSFIVKKSAKDRTAKLRFDIVLDILNTKVEASESASKLLEKKAHNNKIDTLIAKKQEAELETLSVEELEGMRK